MKIFLKILQISLKAFPEILTFLIILMKIFEKCPKISGIRPILKFCPDPRKTDPQKHLADPLNPKILHV